jgi:hypothetical protein
VPALGYYLELLSGRNAGLLSAFYLIGSIALDAFEKGHSDVDFVAVLNRQPAASDIARLRECHREIQRLYPQCRMDGSYWQIEHIHAAVRPSAPVPGYRDSRFVAAACTSLTPVDCWLLARHGVTIIGQEPACQELGCNWSHVTGYMMANLNTYWLSFTRQPRRLAWLLADRGVQWAVLGISRLWYALDEGDLPSKLQAGLYLLARVPERRRGILTEAIALREGTRTIARAWPVCVRRSSSSNTSSRSAISGTGLRRVALFEKLQDDIQGGQRVAELGQDDGQLAAMVGRVEQRLHEHLPDRKDDRLPLDRSRHRSSQVGLRTGIDKGQELSIGLGPIGAQVATDGEPRRVDLRLPALAASYPDQFSAQHVAQQAADRVAAGARRGLEVAIA